MFKKIVLMLAVLVTLSIVILKIDSTNIESLNNPFSNLSFNSTFSKFPLTVPK